MSERPSRLSPEYAAWADEKIVSLGRRVAELEAKLAVAEANLEIARANAASNDLAQETLRFRIPDLVALLIQVVHCGGQCSAELLAKIERATQEEAGWTDRAAPR